MEDQIRLVDLPVLFGRRERLSRDRHDRNHGVRAVPDALAGDFPVEISRQQRNREQTEENGAEDPFHVLAPSRERTEERSRACSSGIAAGRGDTRAWL